ncbi:MAG: glycosyltransferase family 4 protein [Magnetococcus sp. DMHC-6]
MKLSFICHEFPPIGGGASTALDQFTHLLTERGHAIQVVTIGLGLEDQEMCEASGRIVIRLGVGRKRILSPSHWELLRSTLALRSRGCRLIQKFNPQVVIAFFAIPAGWVIRSQLAEFPQVVWLRGSDVPKFSRKRWGWLRFFQPWMFKKVLRQAPLVLANGESLRRMAWALLPNQSIIILTNGVDLKKFYPHENKTQTGCLRILVVGQLIARKRCLELLQGVAYWAKERGGVARVTFVGEGPLKGALEALSQEIKPAVEVNLVGFVSREELPDLYRAHDLLAHLSQAEGVSNVLLEAMASGLPILSTTSAVGEELANAPGIRILTLSQRVPETIGSALAELDCDRQQLIWMGQQARQAVQAFDWQQRAATFEQLLGKILGDESSSL